MSLSPAAAYPHLLAGAIEAQRSGPWDLGREQRVIAAARATARLAPAQATLRRECGALLLRVARGRGGVRGRQREEEVLDEARDHYEQALRLEPATVQATLESAAAAGADTDFLLELASGTGATATLQSLVELLVERGLWERAEPGYWARAKGARDPGTFAAAAAAAFTRRKMPQAALD